MKNNSVLLSFGQFYSVCSDGMCSGQSCGERFGIFEFGILIFDWGDKGWEVIDGFRWCFHIYLVLVGRLSVLGITHWITAIYAFANRAGRSGAGR